MLDQQPEQGRRKYLLHLEQTLYRFALRLCPQPFRDLYRDGMVAMFDLRLREVRTTSGSVGSLAFVVRELVGLIVVALKQRVRDFNPAYRRRVPHAARTERHFMSALAQEIRHAARRLIKSPGFTAATVVTLAVGIGANAAIFSVVNSVVLNPLPYPDSDRLVWLDHGAPGIGTPRGLDMTSGLYVHYRALNKTLEEVAIYFDADLSLTGDGEPERVNASLATHTLFDVLRVPPLIGRWLTDADDYSGGTGAAVLSHQLWSTRYGSDQSIVGRTIQLDGTPVEVVGVMPPDFGFPSRDTQLWIPLVVDPATARFGGFNRHGIARLKPGFEPADAQVDIESLIPRLTEAFPGSASQSVVNDARLSSIVIPLKEQEVGDIERTLWILVGTVGIILLIACANVANLFLVRAESRQREIAVRKALGADRGQMVLHFLTESTMLAVAGGVIGVGLALLGVHVLVNFGPASIPRLHEVAVNGTVIAFTGGISFATGILFGMIPSTRAMPHLVASLREGGRGATAGHTRLRARNVLVASQVALALILLVAAGLMTRSFWHLINIDPGFESKSVLTFQVGLSTSDHPSRESAVAFHQELMDRLNGLPSVELAGAVTCLPLCGAWAGSPLYVKNSSPEPGVIPPVVAHRRVSAGYFETLKVSLLSGRTIELQDQQQRNGAAVVNAALVQRFWPGQNPIGKMVYHGGEPSENNWYTVVGVVENSPIRNLTDDPSPTIYLPLLHSDSTRGVSPQVLTYVVRTSTPPLELARTVRREVWAMNPNLPIARVQSMEQLVSDAGIQMAFTMVLLALAAAVALLLGAVGIYGVVSYVVSQRTQEIGVRVALGAQARQVSSMVLKHASTVALVGIGAGLIGAFVLTRFMRTLLFGVLPVDPVTFVVVPALLLCVNLLASYVPARRAARIDPVEALRSE